MPAVVPGAAVSPGTRICSLVKAPGFTVIAEVAPGVFVPSVMSVAVTIFVPPPAVFRVTLNVFVPATREASAGNVAFASVEAIPTVSVTVLTRFQTESTAFTVTLNAVAAV